MEFCGFISDGYTRAGYINAVPRQSPALRFKYRPLLSQNRVLIQSKINKTDDPAAGEAIAAQAIASAVKEWDLKDDKGQSVPINAANILRVEPNLSYTLYRIVSGYIACDEDPEWSKAERVESDALERALSGVGPEEADIKN